MAKEEVVFLRKATGLVRAWSFLDILAFNSWANPFCGLPTSFCLVYAAFWPDANVLPAIMLFSAVLVTSQVTVYSQLVSTMPRAGGEYVWMSRIFPWPIGPLVGFMLPLIGWVIVLMLWFPLLGVAIAGLFFQPIAVALGYIGPATAVGSALWWMTADGVFWASIWLIAAGLVMTICGMKWCGRFMSSSYVLGGLIAVVATIIILVAHTPAQFTAAYNTFYAENFGISGAYQAVIDEAKVAWGWPILGFWDWRFLPILSMFALVAYYNSWNMWGAPLYGEVKGATALKTSFWSMEGCNILNNFVLLIPYIVAWVGLVGWEFFQSSNLLYGTFVWNAFNPEASWLLYEGTKVWPMLWPSPTLFIYLLTRSTPLTLAILIPGTYFITVILTFALYLPAIRILFAMAFDRILPSPLAALVTKYKIPIVSLLVCVGFGLIYTWLYCYTPWMAALTFQATFVLIASFIGTVIAAAILPWRLPAIWKASPGSKYRVGRIPLISIAAVISLGFFFWIWYKWLTDPYYGIVTEPWVWSPVGLTFFIGHYVIAAMIFIFMVWYRKRQGIDVSLIYKEIPVE